MACQSCEFKKRIAVEGNTSSRRRALGEMSPSWGLGLLLVGSIVASVVWNLIPPPEEQKQ